MSNFVIKNMEKVGESGFIYKTDENPVERLRNKLSVLFLVIESGKCEKDMRNEALKVMPEIIEHLENVENFYTSERVRSFRVRHRIKNRLGDSVIVKHRDFVNDEKFAKYGINLYRRYNSMRDSTGEICEMKNNKWVVLTEEEIKKLYE